MGVSYYEVPASAIPAVPTQLFVSSPLEDASLSASVNVTGSATTFGFPRTYALGIAGNQSMPPVPYTGQVSGHQISNSGYFSISSYDSNPAAWAGRFDAVLIGANWEAADGNGAYDRALLVDAIKQICGGQAAFQPAYVFQYMMMESIPGSTSDFDGCLTIQVNNMNWWLYSGSNQSGSKIAAGSNFETDWAVAWPNGAYGVAADTAFNPKFSTAFYDGSNEDLPQYAAAYFSDLAMIRQSAVTTVIDGTIAKSQYEDTRFHPFPSGYSNNDANKAPNIDGLWTDNILAIPYYTGYYTLQSQDSKYDYTSEVDPWLIRGYYHCHKRFLDIMAKAYPGRTYYPGGNYSSWTQLWASQGQARFNTVINGVSNFFQHGLLEGQIGASYSLETSYGTNTTVLAYQAMMNFANAPKVIAFMGFVSGSTDYQNARYILGCALMDDGFVCINDQTYSVDHHYWWDEYGGNPGTNIPKWWLGQRNGAKPTGPGINGAWVADFQNGTCIMNPKGNGTQTITNTQINNYLHTSYNFSFFKGVQNPSLNSGNAMTSVTLQAGDAVLLRH